MTQNFRTAFRGFNQEDVVNYLEFMNNQYTIRVNQITSEVDHLRKKLIGLGSGEDEVAKANAALDSLRREHEALKDKYNAIKNKLDLMEQAEDRTEDLNAMEAVIEKLQAENKTLKQRCARLENEKAEDKKAKPFRITEEPKAAPAPANDDFGDLGFAPDPELSHRELESDLEIYLNNLEPVDKGFDFTPSYRKSEDVDLDFAPKRKEETSEPKVQDVPSFSTDKLNISFDVEDYLPKVNKPERDAMDLDDDFENLRRVMAKARKTLDSFDFDD